MTIETPEDLAEAVADWLGIYGCCDQKSCKADWTCCRNGFVPNFEERICAAVHNETELDKLDLREELNH